MSGGAPPRPSRTMSRAVLHMSMSLDGFIAAPGDDVGRGLGLDGERLHEWLGAPTPDGFAPPGPGARVYDDLMGTGAVVVGRRTFDLAGQWGGDHHGVPIFVPTRREPPAPASALVHYVTDGLEAAMARAKEAAGERDVLVHGAELAQALLRAGLLDELAIALVPVVLGAGRPLLADLARIELDVVGVLDTPQATHLRYRVRH